jgi:hypothetical protein
MIFYARSLSGLALFLVLAVEASHHQAKAQEGDARKEQRV